jgi:hypothetical protein
MKDAKYIITGLCSSGKLYPKFNKNRFNYSYLFGKIIKVTIIHYFINNEGKHFFVRTENGNLRNIHENKIFNSITEATIYVKSVKK